MRVRSRTVTTSRTALLLLGVTLAACGGAEPTEPPSASAEDGTTAAPASADGPSSGTDDPGAGSDGDDAEATPDPPANRTVTPSELHEGMCLVLPSSDTVANFSAIDCELEHDLEVIEIADLDTGEDTYPGREPLQEAAYEVCEGEAFESYVGTPYPESTIYVEAMVPTPASWAEANRDGFCMAYVPDERITGSVLGSGR